VADPVETYTQSVNYLYIVARRPPAETSDAVWEGVCASLRLISDRIFEWGKRLRRIDGAPNTTTLLEIVGALNALDDALLDLDRLWLARQIEPRWSVLRAHLTRAQRRREWLSARDILSAMVEVADDAETLLTTRSRNRVPAARERRMAGEGLVVLATDIGEAIVYSEQESGQA
jgi:hypothetical protein